MKSFINEARLLAQFDHASLLKVYRFWEGNGTAYMVMPFLEGATLRDTVRGFAEPPGEAWIVALLAPLFDALAMLHAAQCYHRDIAPDNILLLADGGRPLLLDFGAARRVIGEATQALTAILKPGYAPVEQYAEIPGLKQGPWTEHLRAGRGGGTGWSPARRRRRRSAACSTTRMCRSPSGQRASTARTSSKPSTVPSP